MANTKDFYEQLAAYYPFLYGDWERSVVEQTRALDEVIRAYFEIQVRDILDAACGIGTQAIGLAELGYQVIGADIAAAALNRAVENAVRRGVQLSLLQADMRFVGRLMATQFDLVIACDNAIPHLLTDDDILTAFKSFYACTRQGGGALISVRDYANIRGEGTQINIRRVQDDEERRLIIFDTWDFEGEHYDLSIYIVEDDQQGQPHTVVIRGGRYYCVRIERLVELFQQAGFRQVDVLREAFFQPLIVAKK